MTEKEALEFKKTLDEMASIIHGEPLEVAKVEGNIVSSDVHQSHPLSMRVSVSKLSKKHYPIYLACR